jgi:hypothetical protein
MTPQRITKEDFKKIREKYEDAVQARADTIVALRDELGWTFASIGEHFGISRQAAEKIYREKGQTK